MTRMGMGMVVMVMVVIYIAVMRVGVGMVMGPGRRLNKSTMDLFKLPLSVQLMPATSGNEPICEGKLVSGDSRDGKSHRNLFE